MTQYSALSPEVQSACLLFTPSALLPPLLQPAQDPSMAPNRCTCCPVTPGVAPPPAGRQGEGQLGSEHPENALLGPLMGPILRELGSALQQVDGLKEVFSAYVGLSLPICILHTETRGGLPRHQLESLNSASLHFLF